MKQNYTRNQWNKTNEWNKTTLETSETKLHSKPVKQNYTQNEWNKTTLKTSETKLHSKRVKQNYTQIEWNKFSGVFTPVYQMLMCGTLMQSVGLWLLIILGDNLQPYLGTMKLRKLTVVFEYYEAKETYSRIWVLRG